MGHPAAIAAGRRGEGEEAGRAAASAVESGIAAAAMIARARRLMIVSGFTTLIAIAAVIAVIGYRVFHAAGSGAAANAQVIVTLPKGARVVATAVAGERIVVTLDIAGASEIRTFDAKTLQEIGCIRFVTAP